MDPAGIGYDALEESMRKVLPKTIGTKKGHHS